MMMMMMTTSDKLICPNCRVEMNHHCDKLLYGSDSHGTPRVDECGGGASRPAGA